MPIPLSAETEVLARQLAAVRGQSIDEAVRTAVRDALARAEQPAAAGLTANQQAKVDRMLARVKALPPLDDGGDPDAALYDDHGLPR
ncbi:type II toxin-antitoxin system VapB family antitoxin [Azospirillum sp. B506]|uniref:type II toxin-antitoxin system VapB family antitoxin n=1 Tax=Azospirillum sp. B506 TaxID=137721 RepID=UPI00034B33C5|nr:type II toxin-antitoxin system VapB family antitoxin [Azospirillum sp. B506]